MEAIAYEHGVAIAGFHRALAQLFAGVQVLKRKSFGLANPVIVDLIQSDLIRRIVYVVLMGRITRPVSARRVDLDHHKFVGRKSRHHYIDNLARDISTATKAADHITRRDQSWFETRFRRRPALRDFAEGLGLERDFILRRKVDCIGKAVKNISTTADVLRPRAPVCVTGAAQQNKSRLFVLGPRSIDIPWLQTPHE